MKKLFVLLALAGVMTSCNNKKKDEKKSEETTSPTTTPNADATTTTAVTGVPTFSDPEVQKFANEYAAFIAEYKTGMKDPSKMAELSKQLQDWSTRSSEIGTKLASTPDESATWTQWLIGISNDLLDDME